MLLGSGYLLLASCFLLATCYLFLSIWNLLLTTCCFTWYLLLATCWLLIADYFWLLTHLLIATCFLPLASCCLLGMKGVLEIGLSCILHHYLTTCLYIWLIQKTCLKVIHGEDYLDYQTALKICGLESLEQRREKRCIDFSLKCLKHEKNHRLFPSTQEMTKHDLKAMNHL